MDARAALAAVVVALAGCGDDSSISGGADMGMAFTDMSFKGSDLGKACPLVTITAVDSLGHATSTAPALLIATTDARALGTPHWTVQRTGDPTVHTPMATDPSGYTVQYQVPADQPGSWTFEVTFQFSGCASTQTKTLLPNNGNTAQYRLRALPPESTGFPLDDTVITVYGGTPLKQDIGLVDGTPISFTLAGPSGGTPGQVRFIADRGPDGVAITDGGGAFSVRLLDSARYQPLLIPRATSLAPHLGNAGQAPSDFTSASFVVGAGATVTGSVGDGTGPIAGVKLVLRARALPSGTGVSAADGSYSLHAEPGSYALSFGSDAWPQATLAGVAVPGGGVAIAVQYTVARVAVGGKVVASDGATPIGGARVTIVSRPLVAVANVTVGGGAPVAVGGRVTRVVTADASGNLPSLLLPAATYDLIVEPPSSSSDGLTAITRVVSGAASWTLQLQTIGQVSGIVRDGLGHAVVGARVTATETVGLGAAPWRLTDGSGRYTIPVDRGAPIALLVEPTADVKLSSATVMLPAGSPGSDVVLGPGLLVTGVVYSVTTTNRVPSVRIEALCNGCGSSTPIATAISDTSGSYNLYLPDPGLAVSDGGTD